MTILLDSHKAKTYKTISENSFLDENFQELNPELIKVFFDKKVGRMAVANKNGAKMHITEGMFDNLARLGHRYIKVDFTKSRPSIIRNLSNFKSAINNNQSSPISTTFDPTSIKIETTKLVDVEFDERLFQPIRTGQYVDKFISKMGGFMPATNILLTGDPGVGKSSNLMDFLVKVKEHNSDRKVLYISAEMSPVDVKEFEAYYPGIENIDFFYIGEYFTLAEEGVTATMALQSVLHQGWDLVVMDSFIEVQGIVQDDIGGSGKAIEKWILELLRLHNGGHNTDNIFTTFLLIQQKNKAGDYVGSRRLEHMTTAFLELKWDKNEPGRRYMEFSKNRKGQEKVRLYYSFAGKNGIAYDETRHASELEMFERMTNPTQKIESESMTIEDLQSLFGEKKVGDHGWS